jgi:fatty acid synthase subunit alpha
MVEQEMGARFGSNKVSFLLFYIALPPTSVRGPVAVKRSKIKDEPIKDLLGNINSYLIRKLLEQCYAGGESRIPTVEYLSQKPVAPSSVVFPSGIQREVVDDEVTYRFGKDIPDVSSCG